MLVINKKRYFSLFTGFILVTFILGCGLMTPNEPQTGDRVSIAASVNMPHQALATADLSSIVMVVTGNDIETIQTNLVLDGTKAKGTVDVPVDKQLTFTVSAYRDTVKVLEGSTVTTVKKGQANSIPITLDFLISAIILTPPDSVISVGDSISVFLQARSPDSLSAIGARVSFNQNSLQVVDLSVEQGYLESNGGNVNLLKFTQDNSNGTVDLVVGIFPASSYVNSVDGKVGKIVFRAISADTVDLGLSVNNEDDSDLGVFDYKADLVNSLGLGSRIIIQ